MEMVSSIVAADGVGGADGQEQERKGVFFCPDCECDCNGPMQHRDHLVGKRHLKHVRRHIAVTGISMKCDEDEEKGWSALLPSMDELRKTLVIEEARRSAFQYM